MNGHELDRDGQLDIARAEVIVDSVAQSIAGFASRVGFEIMRGAALAREEAEDILAEAQNIAHTQQR
ncbi:MAG: hypothetical protein NVS2B16_24660 [Chloroflexota bacterium]